MKNFRFCLLSILVILITLLVSTAFSEMALEDGISFEDLPVLDISDDIVVADELNSDLLILLPEEPNSNPDIPESLQLGIKETYSLEIEKAQFSSSDQHVATVSKSGIITAKHKGTATITVKRNRKKLGTCIVTVLAPPKKVRLSNTELDMFICDSFTLSAKLPRNTASKKLIWTSNDETVARVDDSGNITALSVGSAIITVTTFNKRTATCNVIVQSAETATDIAFQSKSISIGLRESVKIPPVIIGGDVIELNWNSSNSNVATVDRNGKITGKKVGKARISVVTQKKLTASMIVHVRNAPDRIALRSTLTIIEGQSFTLAAKLPPKTASYKYYWKSSNKKIATVDSNGLVVGLKAGTVEITVQTFNNIQAACTVTVKPYASLPEPLLIDENVYEYDLSGLQCVGERTELGHQDIAIYNGTIFGVSTGRIYINGEPVPITNGHGNNCMFGKELHGDYPYLYCGSWNKDDCKIYINQLSSEGATLVKTISYPGLQGYLNCCVDEPNQRIYILLNISERTQTGVVDFIISDFDGNILSRHPFGKLPGHTGYDLSRGANIRRVRVWI